MNRTPSPAGTLSSQPSEPVLVPCMDAPQQPDDISSLFHDCSIEFDLALLKQRLLLSFSKANDNQSVVYDTLCPIELQDRCAC